MQTLLAERSAAFPGCRIADFPVGNTVKAQNGPGDCRIRDCTEKVRFSGICRLKALRYGRRECLRYRNLFVLATA